MHHCMTKRQWVNSLAPRRSQINFRKVIFKLTLVNGGWGISYEIALRWMPQDLTDDRVMAWCRQATSHYLSQCRLRSMSPNASLGLNELKHSRYLPELSWLASSLVIEICPPAVCCLRIPTPGGIILCMRPANERCCFNRTSSLIGWVHTQNDPCTWTNTLRLRQYGLQTRFSNACSSVKKFEFRFKLHWNFCHWCT